MRSWQIPANQCHMKGPNHTATTEPIHRPRGRRRRVKNRSVPSLTPCFWHPVNHLTPPPTRPSAQLNFIVFRFNNLWIFISASCSSVEARQSYWWISGLEWDSNSVSMVTRKLSHQWIIGDAEYRRQTWNILKMSSRATELPWRRQSLHILSHLDVLLSKFFIFLE